MYVLVSESANEVTYQQLQKLGIASKINEIGTSNIYGSSSVLAQNQKAFHTEVGPINIHETLEDNFMSDQMTDNDETKPNSDVVRGDC